MSKAIRWWNLGYLPLLARCGFVISLGSIVVFITLYPDREREAEAYELARVCADAHQTNCRRMTAAEYVATDCQRNALGPKPDDFCEMQLRVGAATKYIAVDRERTESLRRGDVVHIEIFQSAPTAIEFDGALVPARGQPREAARTLRYTLMLWIPIGLVSAVYLRRERKRAQVT